MVLIQSDADKQLDKNLKRLMQEIRFILANATKDIKVVSEEWNEGKYNMSVIPLTEAIDRLANYNRIGNWFDGFKLSYSMNAKLITTLNAINEVLNDKLNNIVLLWNTKYGTNRGHIPEGQEEDDTD